MGKSIETTIDRFDGGIVNDSRDIQANTSRYVANFDILSSPWKLCPYRESDDGDSSSSTSRKQNFCVAKNGSSVYNIYGLGVVSGTPRAEILSKATSGISNGLEDATWGAPANNQSTTGSTAFDLFVYYEQAALVIGARAGTNLWAFSPTGSEWLDSWKTLSYTTIRQGLVHSKDDILYIPYNNKIASYNHVGTAYNATALTLPAHLRVEAISEYGNFLAIACSPKSGVGNSIVYLWNRDDSLATLSESVDWGPGVVKVLEQLDGILIGVTHNGGTTTKFQDRITVKALNGSYAVTIKELVADDNDALMTNYSQVENGRLFFTLKINYNEDGTAGSAVKEGLWSIGRSGPTQQFTIIHERTLNNSTALITGQSLGFLVIGDFIFQAYINNNVYKVGRTDHQANYSATSIYESKTFNNGGSFNTVDLMGVSLMTEPMPTAGQVILKYRTDEAIKTSTWTTIFTNAVDNSISYSATKNEDAGTNLPVNYKEIEFRAESTGGACITGIHFKEDVTDTKPY